MAAKAAEAEVATTEETKKEDTFVKGETTAEVTYKPPKRLTADQRTSINEQMANSYQQMLTNMVSKQANAYNQVSGNKTDKKPLDPASSIAPGGEYSVDAVATRLMDMAKSLAGGDKSKIALLRDAVEKGFKAAGVELGGKLPSISQDTLAEVRKRFDEWENET